MTRVKELYHDTFSEANGGINEKYFLASDPSLYFLLCLFIGLHNILHMAKLLERKV
jgi:hypothetical protein